MSAGGEALLPRDAWPGPASDGAEASGRDAWGLLAAVEDRVWIIDPQTLFRRGLTLLLRQWNPRLAVADVPDIGAALSGMDRIPGLVLSGEVYLPRGVLTRWTERRPEPQRPGGRGASALYQLTPRQSEVLEQLTLGLSNKEIARALGLLESTVKVHVKTILKKLAASNRTQAAMMARDMGLARRSPG